METLMALIDAAKANPLLDTNLTKLFESLHELLNNRVTAYHDALTQKGATLGGDINAINFLANKVAVEVVTSQKNNVLELFQKLAGENNLDQMKMSKELIVYSTKKAKEFVLQKIQTPKIEKAAPTEDKKEDTHRMQASLNRHITFQPELSKSTIHDHKRVGETSSISFGTTL